METFEQEVHNQIEIVLNRDLELLDPEERIIERWFQLLGDYQEYKNTKPKFIELNNLLEDIDINRSVE